MKRINFLIWFNNLSIKRKITYLYLPLAIIPMIAFAFLTTQLYEKSIVKRSLDTMTYNDVLISNQIESILSEAESCSTYLTISINNLVNSNQNNNHPMTQVKFDSQLTNELAYAKLIFGNIDAIAFVNTKDKVYLSDYNLQYDLTLLKDGQLMADLKKSSGNTLWKDFSKNHWMTTRERDAMISLSKKVWNINTGETIGYLFIHISENHFYQLFKDQTPIYYIVDGKSRIVSSNQRESIFGAITIDALNSFVNTSPNPSTLIDLNRDTFMVSKRSISKMDWTLVSLASLNSFTADMQNLLLLTLVILLTIILLDIAMSSVLTQWITKPIHLLINGLEEIAKGHFDYKFNMKTKDEIGQFATQFNHMSGQIGELLNRVTKEEAEKRTYELALIQEQIKPHFLYNTLDIITKLIEMGQLKKAQKATKRLADFYRHSLSGGADIVSVTEELRMTQDYLELQKIRYSDVFEYHIQAPENDLGLFIPKLTLQPLVENAIYHGLKYRSDSGFIKICVFKETDGWIITIEDNGVGIEPQALEQLNANLKFDPTALEASFPQEEHKRKHFGIQNVNHRIRLFFGKDYGLSYTSHYQKNTKATIHLPQGGSHD